MWHSPRLHLQLLAPPGQPTERTSGSLGGQVCIGLSRSVRGFLFWQHPPTLCTTFCIVCWPIVASPVHHINCLSLTVHLPAQVYCLQLVLKVTLSFLSICSEIDLLTHLSQDTPYCDVSSLDLIQLSYTNLVMQLLLQLLASKSSGLPRK